MHLVPVHNCTEKLQLTHVQLYVCGVHVYSHAFGGKTHPNKNISLLTEWLYSATSG